MENEELAIRIRTGEKNLLPELWKQVEKFVRMQSGQYYRTLQRNGITISFDESDLVNECYFALLEAVEYFDIEKGSFLTALSFHMKKSFRKVSKLHYSKKTSQYNKYHYLSETTNRDEETSEMIDFIEDKNAYAKMIDAESALFLGCVRKYIKKAIKDFRIPQRARNYIELVYFKGVPQDDAMEILGFNTRQSLSNVMSRTYSIIKNGKYGEVLREMLNVFESEEITQYYSKTEKKAIKNICKDDTAKMHELEKWLISLTIEQ